LIWHVLTAREYLDESVLQIKTKIVSCHTTESKPVKQEGNGTVILPPLAFPDTAISHLLELDGMLEEMVNYQ
jgi:hypothetical protein